MHVCVFSQCPDQWAPLLPSRLLLQAAVLCVSLKDVWILEYQPLSLKHTHKAKQAYTTHTEIDGSDLHHNHTSTSCDGGRGRWRGLCVSNCLFGCRWARPSSLESLAAPHLLSVLHRDTNEVMPPLNRPLKSSGRRPDGRPECSPLLCLCPLLPQ